MNVQLQVILKLLNPARLHKTNSVKYRLYSPTAMTNAYMEVKKTQYVSPQSSKTICYAKTNS